MSGITDLNIVLQQGGGAKEAQQIRHAVHDQNHMVAAHQKEKEFEKQTQVQQSDQSDKPKLDNELSEKRRRRRRSKRKPASDCKRFPSESGKLVDTVA